MHCSMHQSLNNLRLATRNLLLVIIMHLSGPIVVTIPFIVLLLNFTPWIESVLSHVHDSREHNMSSDFAAISWTPLQVLRPTQSKLVEQEIIVSIPSGRIVAGTILGIMGPSGCGKTTLLEVLANSLNGLHASGSVNILSKEQNSIYATQIKRKQVGYVHQEDNLFPMLTVRETLFLAASIKAVNSGMKMHTRFAEVNPAINETLHLLGLDGVADSLVGIGGVNQQQTKKKRIGSDIRSNTTSVRRSSGRGAVRISGGERKRLAIGCEVISCHGLQDRSDDEGIHLLIADEPTSGLDSYQALRVVRVLKELAKSRNLAVVATLHQPRSSIFELLDDLLLLTPLGRPAYYGPRHQALDYFAGIGYTCPPFTNPAEFLIDLISFDNDNAAALEASHDRISQLVDAFDRYHRSRKAPAHSEFLVGDTTLQDIIKTEETADSHASAAITETPMTNNWRRNSKITTPRPFFFSPVRAITGTFQRTSLLLQRTFRQVWRDVDVNIARMGVYSVLAILIGKVYGGRGGDGGSGGGFGRLGGGGGGRGFSKGAISGRVNTIANAGINVAMLSMIKTLQIFKREKIVVDRERAQGLYCAAEYLFSKTIAELPLDALAAAIFGSLLHNQAKLSCRMDRFVSILAVLSAVCSSLGLALGAIFPGDVALAAGPALMVIYVVLGSVGPAGSVDEDLPAMLRPVKALSPIKWTCQGLLAEEFKGRNFDETEAMLAKTDPRSKFLRLAKGGMHAVLSVLTRVLTTPPQPSPSREAKTETHTRHLKDGDRALQALGIPKADYAFSMRALMMLFAGHMLLAFIGLVASRPTG